MSESEAPFENPHDKALESLLDEQLALQKKIDAVQPHFGDDTLKQLGELEREHASERYKEVTDLLAKIQRPLDQ